MAVRDVSASPMRGRGKWPNALVRRLSCIEEGGAQPCANQGRSAGSLVLVARCGHGYRDETRSSPGDRIGPENFDLVGARTEGSNMIDGGLQCAARKPGPDSTTTRVNLEFAISACPCRSSCHAFKIPLRRAAKRSSSSYGSDSPPQPRTNSRIPVGIDSSSASCPGRGAPCFCPVGRVLPRTVRSPLPITAWWARYGQKSSFRGRSSLGRGIQARRL